MRIEYLEPYSIRSTNKKRTSLTFDPSSFCDPYRIQTCNLLIRSQMLYSVELRGRFSDRLRSDIHLCIFLFYEVHLLLFDPCLLTGEVSQIENSCPAYLTDFVQFDRIDER